MNRYGPGRAATKAELVKLREEMEVARQGLELLENKRDALMQEAMRWLRKARDLRLDLSRRWRPLQGMWDDCLKVEGFARLSALAAAVTPAAALQGIERGWMSARLAEFSYARPSLGPVGAVFDCSVRPERVRGLLADLLPDLIHLQSMESNVRRLAAALRRCQRQVNALDNVIIPEMLFEQRRIEQRLEEKEREALFQVKRLKARLA